MFLLVGAGRVFVVVVPSTTSNSPLTLCPVCYTDVYGRLVLLLGLILLSSQAYAHFNPIIGRWISRDPIEEEGGSNLYSFLGNSPTETIDYLGMNPVVISGGVNTRLDIDPNHDKNYQHFITAAKLKLKELAGKLKKGEVIEWYIEETTYRTRNPAFARSINNLINVVNSLTKSMPAIDPMSNGIPANRLSIHWYKNKKELATMINSGPSGTRSGSSLITEFSFYGHGNPGELWLQFRQTNPNAEYISSDDLLGGLLLKQAFDVKCLAECWACNSVTPQTNGGPSISGAWHSYFGFGLKGAMGATDYYGTGTSRNPFYQPKPPAPPTGGMKIQPPGN